MRQLDQILVIDIEATCWDSGPPPGQESEIIEIGVCTLDVRSNERAGKESILVKPRKSTVSPYCTQLTTLTQAQVDKGISFEAACKSLLENYESKRRTWASYGNYDQRQFEQQCLGWKIAYPFGPTHINIKNLLAIMLNLPDEIELVGALDLLKLPLEGIHHSARDDAWNIAGILSFLISRLRERG